MALKETVVLKKLAKPEYDLLSAAYNLQTRFDDGVRRIGAEIITAPVYRSFSELLDDVRTGLVEDGLVRLLHVFGKSYGESEKEFRDGQACPEYYQDLAERADKTSALNIELYRFNDIREAPGKYRGNKYMFRKSGNQIYLAKLYFHLVDLETFGIKSDITAEVHGVQAINDASGFLDLTKSA